MNINTQNKKNAYTLRFYMDTVTYGLEHLRTSCAHSPHRRTQTHAHTNHKYDAYFLIFFGAGGKKLHKYVRIAQITDLIRAQMKYVFFSRRKRTGIVMFCTTHGILKNFR